jgi:probable HAF family extracellular repeat protein
MKYVSLAMSAVALGACAREGGLTDASAIAADFVPPPGYEVFDLGTLGGSSSLPFALNDSGQVVGQSARSGMQILHAFLWEQGQMYDLNPLANDSTSAAQAVNAAGQVAGFRTTGGAAGFSIFHWTPLTPPPARTGVTNDRNPGRPITSDTRVVALNDNGEILADVRSSLYGMHAMTLRSDGAVQLPGLEADAETRPAAWNNRGQAVGMSYVYERGSLYSYNAPVLWDNGTVQSLGLLGPVGCPAPGPAQCGYGEATDINNDGVAIGWSNDSTGQARAFVWQSGQLQPLAFVFDSVAQPTWAWAINDRGQVAGDWGSPTGGFLWDSGVMTNLGSLGGGGTHVTALGERGEVVGCSMTASRVQRAFVWRNGQMINLGVGPLGATGSTAIAVNSRGDVLGLSGSVWWADGHCGMYPPFRALLWRKVVP